MHLFLALSSPLSALGSPLFSTPGKIRTFNLHVLSVTPLPIELRGHKRRVSVSTRYLLFDRQMCKPTTPTRPIADQGIEPRTSRCKRDAIPLHQSGVEQRRVESDHRLLVQSQSRCHYATSQQVGDRGVEPRPSASKAAMQSRYTNPQCAMRKSVATRMTTACRLHPRYRSAATLALALSGWKPEILPLDE